MSLSSIFNTGVSGLQTAQTQMRVISDNIANIDTKGYVRKLVDQAPLVTGGRGSGVMISQIRLAADQFLQAAGLKATAQAAGADAASGLWNQTQSLFGDPTSSTDFFSGIDQAFSAFSALSANPSSSAARASAVDQLQEVFSDARSIASQLDGLAAQADNRIAAGVDSVNRLLERIDALNLDATRARVQGGDSTGPESQQQQLIDQLSTLMEVRVQQRNEGGVVVRTADGLVLAGEGKAVLAYDKTGDMAEVSLTPPNGAPTNINARLGGGEIKALLDMRNTELPAVKNELAELVSGVAETANRVHNAYSASPPPTTLAGRATGQPLATAVAGFTGATTVSILDPTGLMQRKVDIDFTAGTMSVNGGPTSAFTPANFLTSLNTALGGAGTASYSASGALTLTAAGANGVAVTDPAAGGSDKVGKGFSAFFGLNDLVTSSGPYDYSTGLTAADPHGFTPGGVVKLRVSGPDGSRISDVSFTVPAGTTMANMVTALNQPLTGVGLYGAFSLGADGQVTFASSTGNTLSVVSDSSVRADGLTVSKAFGIGTQERSLRAGSFSIRSDIAANSNRMSLGLVDTTVAVGARALSAGDARGADALAQAGLSLQKFDSAGEISATTQSVSEYASSLSGLIGRKANMAETDQKSAEALSVEANGRRASVEGVNLDQELVNLTTYQQAYNASARLIQAAKDMYDVLLNMSN